MKRRAELLEVGGTDPHRRLVWSCPGCRCDHGVPVPPHGHAWEWNGSLEAPTLSPSVLVTSGHHAAGHTGDCWCTLAKLGEPSAFECVRCHTYIRDGRIEFLGDCSHDHAGRTVEMAPR